LGSIVYSLDVKKLTGIKKRAKKEARNEKFKRKKVF